MATQSGGENDSSSEYSTSDDETEMCTSISESQQNIRTVVATTRNVIMRKLNKTLMAVRERQRLENEKLDTAGFFWVQKLPLPSTKKRNITFSHKKTCVHTSPGAEGNILEVIAKLFVAILDLRKDPCDAQLIRCYSSQALSSTNLAKDPRTGAFLSEASSGSQWIVSDQHARVMQNFVEMLKLAKCEIKRRERDKRSASPPQDAIAVAPLPAALPLLTAANTTLLQQQQQGDPVQTNLIELTAYLSSTREHFALANTALNQKLGVG